MKLKFNDRLAWNGFYGNRKYEICWIPGFRVASEYRAYKKVLYQLFLVYELVWMIKFVYSEKATKFCEISTLLLSTVHTDKSKVEISKNFVAFSEYTNFMIICCTLMDILQTSWVFHLSSRGWIIKIRNTPL